MSPKPAQRRWRWLWISVAVVAVLRLALSLALPPVVASIGRARGLEIRWDDLELSFLTGRVQLHRLEAVLADAAPEDPPLVHLEHLVADVDVSALFTGTVRVHRVEVDGLDLHAERDAEGRWSFEPVLASADGSVADDEEPEPDEAEEPEEPEPFELGLPIELRALRLQHVRVVLDDADVSPPARAEIETTVRLSDLGDPERPARLRVLCHAPELLDALRIDAQLESGGPHLSAALEVALAGLHPQAARAWLAPLGITPVAETITFDLESTVELRPGPNAVPVDEDGEPAPVHELAGDLELTGLVLAADGRPTLALDSIALPIASLGRDDVALGEARVRGLRAEATRRSDGALAVAGLELRPAPAATGAETAEPAGASPGNPGDMGGPGDDDGAGRPFGWTLARLALEDGRLELHDEAVDPPATLALALDEIAVRDVAPGRPDEPLALTARLAAPGLFRELSIEGRATPFAADRAVELTLALDGLAPERAAPYLAAAGIRSTFADGSLRARLEAEVRDAGDGLAIDARVGDVALSDADEWLGLDEVRLREARLSGTGDVAITAVEVAGLRARLARDAGGVLRAAGLAFEGAPPARAGAPDAAPPAPGVTPTPAPVPDAAPARLTIDSVVWRDTSIEWRDEALEEPLALAFESVGLEVANLVLGGAPGAEPVPATLRFDFAQPGLARELALEGTIASRPGPLDVALDLALRAEGLATRAVEPYLDAAGIESQLADASLALDLDATVRETDGGLALSASVTDLALTGAGREWIALERLAAPDVRVAPDGAIVVPRVDVVRPRAELDREADGSVVVAGLRFPASTGDPAAPEPGAETVEPVAEPAPADRGTEPAPAAPFELGLLELTEARVAWSDAAVTPAVATDLVTSARIEALRFPSPDPARLDLRVGLGAALDELALVGTLRPDPDDLTFEARLDVRGLRPAGLAAYFPAGLSSTLDDGRMRVDLTARFGRADAGGHRLALELSDLRLADGPAAEGSALLALERLALDVPRADADGGRFDVAEVAVEGLALPTVRRADGSISALGFAFDPTASPAAPAAPPAAAAPVDEAAEPESILDESAVARPAASSARATTPIPTVTIGKLDVGVASLGFRDLTAPDSEPLDVALRLTLPEATTLLAPETEDLAPLNLTLSGHARPIAETIALELETAPWRAEPEVALTCALAGLRGRGLTEVLPELAATLDGSGLDGGSVELAANGVLRWRRRNPLDFDTSGGFGLSADVTRLAVRAQPDGPVLYGVEGAHLDVERIRPATGDIHVEALEIDRPIAHVLQTEEGLVLAGVLLKAPAEAESSPEEALEEPPEEAAEDAVTEVADSGRAGGDVRLDRLVISGLDFELVDRSVEPPFVVPLDDLEVEVERFTTRALEEPIPIQFRASLYGGDVELPERDAGSFLGGLLSSAADLVTFADEEVALEPRPVVDEVALSGRLTLVPQPKGWVKLNVAALELPALRGPARAAGVEIGDGLMTTDVEVRFRGEQGMTTDVDTRFEFLSLSEPADGPISSFLKLPAPLDTVLFVLRNEQGEHEIPLSLAFGPDGLSIAEITRGLSTTLAKVVTDAIAASPFRVVGGVIDLTGLGPGEPVELTDQTVRIPFDPATTTIRASAWDAIEPLREILREDDDVVVVVQHAYGSDDLERIGALANPSPADCLRLGARLRERKRTLAERRQELATTVRARIAIGRLDQADETARELRGVERDIGLVETALDRVYELVRPGAERGAARRTRAAAQTIAELRLEAVRAKLVREGIERIRTRIDVRRPRYGEPTAPDGSVTLTPKRP